MPNAMEFHAEPLPIYAFGPFRLDPAAKLLFRDQNPVALGRRAVTLLQLLIESRGVPISKDVLISRAWSDAAVEEGNLTVQIGALRRALGDAGGASWIETLPRRGYRFIGPVAVREQSINTAPPAATVTLRHRLAVLPFTNISSDPEQEYFADGMTDDIVTALAKLHRLAVIGRGSTFVYKGRSVCTKQVGVELGANFVLEGSVRRSGDRLRVTGQLIESNTGEYLWAERYDLQVNTNLFTIQDQITADIVTAIDSVVAAFDGRQARSPQPGSRS